MVSKHLKQNAGQPLERQYTSWRQLEDPKAEILFIYHSTHKTTKLSLFVTTECPILNLHDEHSDWQADPQCSEIQKQF